MRDVQLSRNERVRGTTIGAMIMGAFGAVWLALGMVGAGVPVPVSLAVVVPVFVLIVCLASTLRRRMPKLTGSASLEKKKMLRVFAVVNVVQWVAILGTINLLHNWHLDRWIVTSIVLIVGAHFLPLARIFDARPHVVTGVALMLCATVAIVLPASVRDAVECVSAGLILWASAAAALSTAFQMAPAESWLRRWCKKTSSAVMETEEGGS